jgi:hypothetical protein
MYNPANMVVIDSHAKFETFYSNTEVVTDCSSITLLNQGNCTIRIDNGADLTPGMGVAISVDVSGGLPRLNQKIVVHFSDDAPKTAAKIQKLLVARTFIESACLNIGL